MAHIIHLVVDLNGAPIHGVVEAEDAIADARARIVRTCSEDGTPVETTTHGTSEYARCQHNHRWQYNFNPHQGAGWIQIGG